MGDVYTDDGNAYDGQIVTNQFDISPEQSKEWRGVLDWIVWKRNQVAVNQVEQLTDDDPDFGVWNDISANIIPTPTVTQGTAILTEQTTATGTNSQKTCFLAGVRMTWNAGTSNFNLRD